MVQHMVQYMVQHTVQRMVHEGVVEGGVDVRHAEDDLALLPPRRARHLLAVQASQRLRLPQLVGAPPPSFGVIWTPKTSL